MAKTGNKTTENKNSVTDFIKSVPDQQRQKDAFALLEIIKKQSGFDAKMWGSAIIGFGSYHYKYESGREGDAPLAGLASRANAIVLYLAASPEQREQFLQKLGKHKTSKGCIYIKNLEDIDTKVLGKMALNSVKYLKQIYPP